MSIYTWNTFCPTFFGIGASSEAGNKAKELGMHKVMLCTEKALCDLNVVTPVVDALKEAGLDVYVFDKSKADAPSDICDEGAVFVREHGIDGIVAVGGAAPWISRRRSASLSVKMVTPFGTTMILKKLNMR